MSGAKDFSEDFMVEDAPPAGWRVERGAALGAAPPPAARESDPHRLAQRQKQIDLGKNTLGYQRYRQAVPRERRDRKNDPATPDVYQVCSKRAFDGQVKRWRRMLHAWDLPDNNPQPAVLPVDADTAGPGSNPLAPEASDDFEHISHADAEPKNGGPLRPGGNNLPLKIPSAMRKRGFDETMVSSEAQQPQREREQRSLQAHTAQPARGRGLPDAKQARRTAEWTEATGGGSGRARAAAAAAAAGRRSAAVVAANEPSWAEQRYTEPELDYGSASDEDDGWQRVNKPAQLPGQYKTIFNNEVAWNEEDVQI